VHRWSRELGQPVYEIAVGALHCWAGAMNAALYAQFVEHIDHFYGLLSTGSNVLVRGGWVPYPLVSSAVDLPPNR